MCRIAGIIGRQGDDVKAKASVVTMCKAMRHGGPDDEGYFEDKERGVFFGHRRLSIIDLTENGHQPMPDASHHIWLTFNGEIYNYRELKDELKACGITFRTTTDTEVIIQAYLKWGADSFNKLKGIFAFALYDLKTSESFLVRDSAGIKPLYYLDRDGQLIFASEVRAFRAAALATIEDPRWPVWLLSFGHIPEPHTTLKDVFALPKGHYLKRTANGDSTITKYSVDKSGSYITDKVQARDLLISTLHRAVSRQLVSDAPIGVFLSGGTDSSILSLLADAESNAPVKTISINFDETQFDEGRYQAAVAKQLKGENIHHLVTRQDLENSLLHVMAAMDMPTTDGINSWFISKVARQNGLKAVLSGVGADELFGGYPSFGRIGAIPYLRTLPDSLLSLFGRLGSTGYKRLSYLVHKHPVADYLFLRGLFAVRDIAAIVGQSEHEVEQILFSSLEIPSFDSYDAQHASWFETHMYMQNQLLRDTDVMSMSHGLEVRTPFLDEDFRTAVDQIAPATRFDKRRRKGLLIDSFKDKLPQEVWNRPKMGFTFPLQDWLKNNTLIADESAYNSPFAKKIVTDFKQGKGHWSRVFALFQIQRYV